MLKKSCEKITVDKAKYLLSLSESRLLCEIWNNDELENKEFANKINPLGKDGWQLVDVESPIMDGTTC